MTTIITELPLYSDVGGYMYSTVIEGQGKQLEFYWNTRCGQWKMNIRNEDQTGVVQGVTLVTNYPILKDYDMTAYGLSGYFILLSATVTEGRDLSLDPSALPEFYRFFYVQVSE